MGVRVVSVLGVVVVAGGAMAQEAQFDGLPSGFVGRTFVDGGVTFSENLWFPGGLEVPFAVTNATGSLSGYPEFTPVNVMTTGGWSTGTALGYIRTHQWIATTGEEAQSARVDVWFPTGANWLGTEVSLEGLVGDEVVVSDMFVHPGADGAPVEHRRLSVSGATFERVRFICRGGTQPGELDGIVAAFDNVAIEAGAPCRADIDGDGELTIFDFLGYQNLFDAGDLAADFDGDGELTLFDFLAFQNAFDQGCV
jgi:hypothetical protein